jgi:hypothetical protein
MLKEFGKGWIRSVHADCLNYIEAALKALREKISLLDTVMKGKAVASMSKGIHLKYNSAVEMKTTEGQNFTFLGFN